MTEPSQFKWSPLCSNDGGDIYFTARSDGQKYRVTFPDTLLDAACGATTKARKSWVTEERQHLVSALTTDAPLPGHLAGILIEEIS